MSDPLRSNQFETPIGGDPRAVLYAERLRDGRIALGTRMQQENGEWRNGELHVLGTPEYLALAGWLGEHVETAWVDTLRERRAAQLRTASDLYGGGAEAAERLALETLREVPASLLVRALLLLANSVGPQSRERAVLRLNRTPDPSEEAALRRRLAEEQEAFAFSVAAAALFDAIDRGLASDEAAED